MREELEKTPDYSEYEGKTFGQILDGLARDVPDKEMIVFNGERMTYGQFYQRVITVAMALKKLGIKKGDKVAALFPNCPDFFVVQQAVLYIGAVFVLLSTRYREYELSYMLKHSKARCLFTIDKYLKADFIDIVEGVDPSLEKEVQRLIDQMPDWTPTTIDGEATISVRSLPVVFRLQGEGVKSYDGPAPDNAVYVTASGKK